MRIVGIAVLILLAIPMTIGCGPCGAVVPGLLIFGLVMMGRMKPVDAKQRSDGEWEIVDEDDDIELDVNVPTKRRKSKLKAPVATRVAEPGIFSVIGAIIGGFLNIVGTIIFGVLLIGFVAGIPLFVQAGQKGESLIDSLAQSVTNGWSTPAIAYESRLDPRGNAQAQVRQLFPDDAEYQQVIAWGRGLLAASNQSGNAFGAMRGSEADAASAVWSRLLLAPGANPGHLINLPETIAQNLPPGTDRAALNAWAAQRVQEPTPGLNTAARRGPVGQYPAPPNTPWFRDWVIYDQWLPIKAMFQTRLTDLLNALGQPPEKFGWSTRDALLAWGTELHNELSYENRLMPPAGDRSSLLAVCDQLTGRHLVTADVPVVDQLFQGNNILAVMGFSSLFPNDDVSSLLFGGGYKMSDEMTNRAPVPGPPQMGQFGPQPMPGPINANDSLGWDNRWEWAFIPLTFLAVFLGFSVARGMRFLTVGVFSAMIGIHGHPYKTAYTYNGRRFMLKLLSLIGVVIFTFVGARWVMEPFFVIYIRSGFRLLFIVVWTTLLGGVLIEGLRNIVTMLFIRFGIDPLKTIWDDLTAAILGAVVLFLFQNSWVAVVASVVFGLLPGLLAKAFRKREES